jgi:hypothetical protein
MNDEPAQSKPPSPEVTQLVLLGQLDDAIALHAKQAELDPDEARAAVEAIAD